MSYTEELGIKAKLAEKAICGISTNTKNNVLIRIGELLSENSEEIKKLNAIDIENASKSGKTEAYIERLTLNDKRIKEMVEGLRQLSALPDPIGEVIGGGELKNGLSIVKKRVPLGVIGIIYESRANVTVDAASLCLKSGNVCILRGGSDAINSNKCLVALMRRALKENGVNENAIALVENTSREVANEMMKLNKYIDILIPRGGKGLIHSVIENATVPVIQTGEGNCHVYVDKFADLDMALKIVDNAKVQRPSVCNAIESLLVHESVAEAFLPMLAKLWNGKVKIYGDKATSAIITVDREATNDDYATEFNDYIISVKIVKSIDEAIDHINKYGTKHSEAIVTINLQNAEKFQREIDAAAVYVNASTRYTDGFEFGLGAEIGISTQKLHARGPMGLTELTTYKYLVNGNGQIRS